MRRGGGVKGGDIKNVLEYVGQLSRCDGALSLSPCLLSLSLPPSPGLTANEPLVEHIHFVGLDRDPHTRY